MNNGWKYMVTKDKKDVVDLVSSVIYRTEESNEELYSIPVDKPTDTVIAGTINTFYPPLWGLENYKKEKMSGQDIHICKQITLQISNQIKSPCLCLIGPSKNSRRSFSSRT